jgi:hypothetical protein
MAGQLKIPMQAARRDGVPFMVIVEVSGGQAGDNVTVRLWQSAGVKPFYAATATTAIDINGIGQAIFKEVILRGAGSVARLVADDDVSAVPLSSDEAHIDVVP